jgi:hypothetical protein
MYGQPYYPPSRELPQPNYSYPPVGPPMNIPPPRTDVSESKIQEFPEQKQNNNESPIQQQK